MFLPKEVTSNPWPPSCYHFLPTRGGPWETQITFFARYFGEDPRIDWFDPVVVQQDPLFTGQSARIVTLAEANRLPAIYALRGFYDAGGLRG
jgi:hypothetical protein